MTTTQLRREIDWAFEETQLEIEAKAAAPQTDDELIEELLAELVQIGEEEVAR